MKLAASLCTVFPSIRCDYPRDERGALITDKLADPQLANYHGLLGHYHIQTNKTDPGPALQWDRIIGGARPLIANPPRERPQCRSEDGQRDRWGE